MVDREDRWGGGAGDPVTPGPHATVFHGASFCLSEPNGDIRPRRAQGYFQDDTRLLSTWQLLVDEREPELLLRTSPSPSETRFVLRMPPRPGGSDTPLLVERHRRISSKLSDQVILRNLSLEPAQVRVTLRVDADFADVFSVKEGRVQPQRRTINARPSGVLVIHGERGQGVRVSMTDATYGPDGLVAVVDLAPSQEVVLVAEARPTWRQTGGVHLVGPPKRPLLWRHSWLSSPDATVPHVVERSLTDLESLRISDPDDPSAVALAAGAPWFMALFGRDSLLSAYMTLPLQRDLARGTLRMLADRQGKEVEPLSEEEPGRILHETRFAKDSGLALGGRHIYYGSVDATPLFVVLLAELWRWGEALDELADLLPAADAALEWTRTYGDRDGDGFVEYERTSPRGLENQGWRDSWNGVTYADGRVAHAPIALCEVQGYVYAALVGRAEIAQETGDRRLASRLRGRAERLRERFEEAFWLEDLGWYAMALDGDKRPVDALTSSIGHLLWSGIVPAERAGGLADLLLGEEMFTGWGVRTLASTMGAYNPLSYHNGSVWPHDTAIVAHGLARYGHRAEAAGLAVAMLDAAEAFGGRLPELFGGFSRDEYPEPVPYPTSCSPQAWASGAPLLLLRAGLGLEVDAPRRRMTVSPGLPEAYLPLTWHGVRVGGSRVDVQVDGTDHGRATGLPRGFEVRA